MFMSTVYSVKVFEVFAEVTVIADSSLGRNKLG